MFTRTKCSFYYQVLITTKNLIKPISKVIFKVKCLDRLKVVVFKK